MTALIIILVLVIALPLIYLATLDGNFSVRRSREIAVEPKRVFDKIRDFESWKEWSPWLMHEPDTKLIYSDNPDQEGGWYSWDGKIVGAGKLSHEKFTGIEKIEQKIEFTRPFKSVSRVWWEFEPIEGGKTLVHWNMAGRMPFLFRFLAKKLPQYINKDYDTGLLLLRGKLVPGEDVPDIKFHGPVDLDEQNALSIHFEGDLDALKVAMTEGFPRLGHYADEQGLQATGNPFTVYHRVDMKEMYFECDMALPVPGDTKSSEFELKTYPGGRFYKTSLRGSYEFLEFAWYHAYSHLEMLKIKPEMKRASMEIYENDPDTVEHSNEIETSIYIPIR